MKKFIALALVLLMAVSFAACGSEAPAAPQEPAQTDTPAPAPEVFAFTAGGATFTVGDEMGPVEAILGEPASYFEAESCAFKGLDKVYTYSGFTVSTNPKDDNTDLICSILLTDDSVTTIEGVYIGSPASAVIEKYGEPSGDIYSYEKNGVSLVFVVENDTVVSIEYL